MYLFVARVCNVSTLLVYFVSMCVWGCNHYVVRAVSEWIFWERFPTHPIHHSESKSGQEHEFVCPVVTCFFSTGIFGLINFRGQIHRYWWFIGFLIYGSPIFGSWMVKTFPGTCHFPYLQGIEHSESQPSSFVTFGAGPSCRPCFHFRAGVLFVADGAVFLHEGQHGDRERGRNKKRQPDGG